MVENYKIYIYINFELLTEIGRTIHLTIVIRLYFARFSKKYRPSDLIP